MTSPKQSKSPMVTGLENKDDKVSIVNEVETRKYRSIEGSLLYLPIKTHLDLCVKASIPASHIEKPKEMDWIAKERVLRYVNGTRHAAVVLAPEEENQIVAFADFNWGPQNELKSKTGTGALMKYGMRLSVLRVHDRSPL